ncbi:hypothetical protein CRYUN_Cryun05aG0188800 [Craigia yunnanensis]
MDKTLEDLWNKLTLIEDERTEVLVEKEWIDDPSEVSKNCLLGKILMRKPVNLEVMKTVFMKLWNMSSGLQIKEVGERHFVFQFSDGLAKNVLQKQPWSFNRSLMVLKEFDGYAKPELVNMDCCTFRVQIHGLPLGMMNEKIGTILGEAIEDVEEVETDEEQSAWG